MNWVITVIIVLSCFAVVDGLLLSSSGSTAGLTALRGQDLELFKKTKDRGLIKMLQILMLVILLTIITLLILNSVLGWSNIPTPPPADEGTDEAASLILNA